MVSIGRMYISQLGVWALTRPFCHLNLLHLVDPSQTFRHGATGTQQQFPAQAAELPDQHAIRFRVTALVLIFGSFSPLVLLVGPPPRVPPTSLLTISVSSIPPVTGCGPDHRADPSPPSSPADRSCVVVVGAPVLPPGC